MYSILLQNDHDEADYAIRKNCSIPITNTRNILRWPTLSIHAQTIAMTNDTASVPVARLDELRAGFYEPKLKTRTMIEIGDRIAADFNGLRGDGQAAAGVAAGLQTKCDTVRREHDTLRDECDTQQRQLRESQAEVHRLKAQQPQ